MAYQPLDATTGDIRLLYLLPSVNMEGDIQCELAYQNLDDKSPYSALSYVWGDPEAVEAITLNEKTAYVTRNLFAALRKLRHPTETAYLWVDALCS
jgi:predicted nucleic acid-binding protein